MYKISTNTADLLKMTKRRDTAINPDFNQGKCATLQVNKMIWDHVKISLLWLQLRGDKGAAVLKWSDEEMIWQA